MAFALSLVINSRELLKFNPCQRLFARSRRSAWAGARCPHPSLAAVLTLVWKKPNYPRLNMEQKCHSHSDSHCIRYLATLLFHFRYPLQAIKCTSWCWKCRDIASSVDSVATMFTMVSARHLKIRDNSCHWLWCMLPCKVSHQKGLHD